MFLRVPLSNTDGKMSAPIRTSIWELSKIVGSANGMGKMVAFRPIQAKRKLRFLAGGLAY